jgi:ABC-type phosphate transport system ATPase subunit
MSREIREVQGTVELDGKLVLDEKLNLPAGRVRVTVQPLEKPNPARLLALMEQIWADQKARAHVPRTKEEIDADINQLRNEADLELQAAERLHEDCQRAGHSGKE